MLSGMIFPALAATLKAAPEEGGSRPLSQWQLEQAMDCAEEGETREAFVARSAFVNAEGMADAATLRFAIERKGPGRLVIVQGDFTGEDMRSVAPLLSGACLWQTALARTDWRETEVADLRLERVGLREVKASSARWRGLTTRGVNMAGSDFSGADLSGLTFQSYYQGADFEAVSFRGANLTGARFGCGITVDAWCINASPDLHGTNLTRADVAGLGLWDADENAGAVLDETVIAPRSLANLAAARFDGPVILAHEFGLAYGEAREGPTARLSPVEARTLMAATRVAQPAAFEDRPSFDCAKARRPVETMICVETEWELRALDRELEQVWREVRLAGKGDHKAQRTWLASRRYCPDSACLADKYRLRIGRLRGSLGPRIALAPGQSVSYHGDALPLPEDLRSGELYRRVLPVLRDVSHQTIVLTGLGGGAIKAEGDAIGTNAHLCSLLVDSARFDPATGWWSAEGAAGKVPLLRIDGRRIVLRYSGNIGDTPEQASDYLTCGARAYFQEGIDLEPVQAASTGG